MNCFDTGRRRGRIRRRRGPHKINVFGITRIRFIWFGLNLAWTYNLTLETSPRKNFSFFSKSKMAAGGEKSKIGQILPHKSYFGSSFGSGSSDLDQIWQVDTTQPKEQAYGRIFDLSQNPTWPPQPPLRQITKSVINWKVYNLETHFFPKPMFSRLRNAMKLSFTLFDHSNNTQMAAIRVKIGVWRLIGEAL